MAAKLTACLSCRADGGGRTHFGFVGHQVDLGADALSREAKRMVLRLLGIPFLPASTAERLARLRELAARIAQIASLIEVVVQGQDAVASGG